MRLRLGFFLLWGSLVLASDPSVWMRYNAISPDGSTVVFAYQGDLYRVPATGGTALPLTLSEANDTVPVWSHDGKWLAFASDRAGNMDVYLMPSSGGAPKRLTYHSSSEMPTCFSPDDQEVLFQGSQLDAATNIHFPANYLPELYKVSVKGGANHQVLSFPANHASWRKDGNALLFEDRKGSEDEWRKHHRSSVTRDIVLWSPADQRFEKLTQFEGEDTEPCFAPDQQSFYFLSERGGTFNIYQQRFDATHSAEAITHFDTHPVRFLSVAQSGTLCFGYHGEIFTKQPGEEPVKLVVRMGAQDRGTGLKQVSIAQKVEEAEVSSNGRDLAFTACGEVFVTSTSSETTKQITHTVAEERHPSFSPDGRSLLYSSFREGRWKLYVSKLVRKEEGQFFDATLVEETAVLATGEAAFQGQWSPDGKEIAFIESRTALRVWNLAEKKARTLVPASQNFSYGDGDQYFQWSPDGKYIALNYVPPETFQGDVAIVAADGKTPLVNVSRNGFDDRAPQWSADGQTLTWMSSRDGLRSQSNSGGSQYDVFAMFLTQKAYDRFQLTKEELELLKAEKDPAGEAGADGDKKAESSKPGKGDKPGDKKDAEAKKPELVIEWEGLRDRQERLTLSSSFLADAVLSSDGETLYYLSKTEEKFDLWKLAIRSKETKLLAPVGIENGSMRMDAKGENLFILADGSFLKVDLKSGAPSPIPFGGTAEIDGFGERAVMFEHVYQTVKDKLYAPDLNKVAWDALKADYASRLGDIANTYDFVAFLSEFLGELNVSHTGSRFRPKPWGDRTAELGLYFDPSYPGPGLKIQEVLPKNPILKDSTHIKAGLILEKIDGVALTENVSLHQLLNQKAGVPVLLSLLDPSTNTRYDDRVKPFDQDTLRNLTYKRWVARNRAKVEELSGGRLGYVHVRGMNESSFRTVIDEILGDNLLKEALVVDTRFNTGGDLVSDLSTFLDGTPTLGIFNRDGRSLGVEPTRRWAKPSVVLVNEANYSDGHCFPWVYKYLGQGKLVGMPIPGTCTYVWGKSLQDSEVRFTLPVLSLGDRAGVALENVQLEPDLRVNNDYAQLSQGEDQQLATAVTELLSELKKP